MRLFIAIELPSEVKAALEKIGKDMRSSKAVPRENLHITLKFLGDLPDERVPGIITALSDVKFNPFSIKLERAGAFPSERNAKVIWISAGPEAPLAAVKAQVDKALPRYKDDHPFKSHITLIRTEGDDLRDEIAKMNAKLEKKEILVTKITLYKSTLTPNGPVYEKLT
ncbi:RNA 2',3'-cyclic phosphodiesterase [Candidatus Woesearchaeota archaeon]|nr:RNA 2',3'-cyclic phosphodiesterase [Candidatus Woesearchaeota archaeon]